MFTYIDLERRGPANPATHSVPTIDNPQPPPPSVDTVLARELSDGVGFSASVGVEISSAI